MGRYNVTGFGASTQVGPGALGYSRILQTLIRVTSSNHAIATAAAGEGYPSLAGVFYFTFPVRYLPDLPSLAMLFWRARLRPPNAYVDAKRLRHVPFDHREDVRPHRNGALLLPPAAPKPR